MKNETKEMLWGILRVAIEVFLCWVMTAWFGCTFYEAMIISLFVDYYCTQGRKEWKKINDEPKSE